MNQSPTSTGTARRRIATAAAIACGVLFCVSCSFRHEEHAGKVVEKVYTPSSTQTGTGVAVGSGGKAGVVTITSSEPEKWTVIVDIGNEVIAVGTSAERWASLNKGDTVTVDIALGKHTGWRWNATLK